MKTQWCPPHSTTTKRLLTANRFIASVLVLKQHKMQKLAGKPHQKYMGRD